MLSRTTCPITGSLQLAEKVDLPYDSGLLGEWARQRNQLERFAPYRFTILHNPDIGLYFQQWVFDQQEEVSRREAMAARRPPEAGQLLSLAALSHKAEDAMLIRLLHASTERAPRVLDYGMGGGDWALMATAYGSEVWGTDVDPGSRKVAAGRGIRFAPLEEIPDDYFDFINADQVFEHLPDPLAVVQALASKLAHGGHLKISTPADWRIEEKIALLKRGVWGLDTFKREFHALSPFSHINLFTRDSLQALARAAGLEAFRLSLRNCYAVMTDFHSLRQINRNLYNPLKRHRAEGTWQFFRKP